MDQAPQSNPVPLRYSILELVKEYDDKKPARLDALVRAWKKVQELDPSDPKSFFYLAGFHGFPFRGMGATDAAWWGGYCHHADVLFPTWHRAYCKKVEESLQFFDPTVTLPYWDETDSLSQSKGAPWIFTSRTYKFGEPKQGEDKEIKNPLHSFVLPLALSTQRKEMTEIVYTKPKGYETVRYPYAGLVSDENFQKETDAYNAQFKDMSESQITDLFNENVVSWINVGLTGKGELGAFERCLQAPNYTVFSNTRSSGIWNDSTKENVMPLESPHNHIHLCVGGFKIDSDRSQDYNVATSGDMGENETASFDPIFFFHHCNIDRVFWIWQKLHNQTDQIDIIDDYPGTIGDDQPPAGIALNEYYSLTTPLHPFKRVNESGKEVPFTSQDLINIEKQLGYGYSKGSLDEVKLKEPVERKTPVKKLILEDLNKTDISGSFVVHAFLQNKTNKDDKINLGGEVVLNRWEPKQCKNCKITSQVKLAFEIPDSVKNLEDYEPSFVFGSRKGAVEKEKSLLKAGGDEQYSGRPLKFSTKFVGNN